LTFSVTNKRASHWNAYEGRYLCFRGHRCGLGPGHLRTVDLDFAVIVLDTSLLTTSWQYW